MKKVFPYYKLEASIRYGDKPWPEYPHVYLANMDLSDDSIHAFTRRYGPLFAEYEPTYPLPKTHEQAKKAVIRTGQKLMSLDQVFRVQLLLRESWRNSPDYLKAIAGHDPDQDAFIYRPMQPVISVTDTGIELLAPDAWTFARLAFLTDHAAGKTQICGNPDCKPPHGNRYFVQSKQGQMYCSHKCAVLVNVRRFRLEEKKPKIKTRSTPKRHKR
jgi:hypothetical protein